MLDINVKYDSSVTNLETTNPTLYSEFTGGVAAAVQALETLILTPITVTIDVGYGEIDGQALSSNALGESEGEDVTASYAAARNALIAENAPGSSTLPATSPDQGSLVLTTAQAKALGLAANNGSLDGYVGFSASLPFSYAAGVTPPSNEYYFVGVVEHEMTEVMGRVSLVNDQPNYYSLMDLYRYSASGVRDLTASQQSGSTSYFSINNGATNLGTWNNVASNGDLGDWYPSGPAPGGDDAFNDFSSPGVINQVSADDATLMQAIGFVGVSNPSPPGGTVSDMVAEFTSSGALQIYDIGGNAVLASYPLGQASAGLQFVGFGDFDGKDGSDILLRNTSTGNFSVYDVSNNEITTTASLGQAGLELQVLGIGDFSGNANESDMLLRDTNNGAIEYYDIQNNQVVGAGPFGNVGAELQVLGIGDFSGNTNESDMLMRDVNNGVIEYYDIQGNHVVGAGSLGGVGLEWQVLGIGDFSGNANESDMLMRDVNNGAIEYYDIQHNQVVAAGTLGNIGTELQPVGFGDIAGNPNETDMLMRDVNNGNLAYYDIQHNQVAAAGPFGSIGLSSTIFGIAPLSTST